LLYLDVAPAIGKLLNLWHRSLAAEVDLTEPTKPGTKPTAKLMEVVSSTAS